MQLCGEVGLVVSRVVGLLLALVIDVGVLRTVEEPVMLFSTPILIAGIKRLTLGCGWAITSFMIILPI